MSFEKGYCREIQTDPHGENWSITTREHAAACPLCTAYIESCDELGERLRDLPSLRETMPEDLRGKMLQQLAEAAAPETAAPGRSASLLTLPLAQRIMLPVALAASLVLGIFLEKTFDFGPASFPNEVERTIGLYIEDVTHDHYLLERIARPLEVEITNARDLSTWLSASLNFAFQLPETRGPLTLQGGRVWHTVGRLSAMASYMTESGSRVVLFAVPAENLELIGAESELVDGVRVFNGSGWGHEARVWIDGDLAVALTAPEGEIPATWDEIFLP
ncbi:MAG: hypothetical protein ABFS42_04610 [Candidatus Krumholzibacteriota bacterium]